MTRARSSRRSRRRISWPRWNARKLLITVRAESPPTLREAATHPGASASELVRASRHTPQTLSGLLRRLEDRGLIERSEARGRVVDNRLTPAGHETLAAVTRNVEDVSTAALAGFSPEDRAAFAQLTTRFADALTHHHEPGIPSGPGPSGA